jgi:RHS repeat-associated protein
MVLLRRQGALLIASILAVTLVPLHVSPLSAAPASPSTPEPAESIGTTPSGDKDAIGRPTPGVGEVQSMVDGQITTPNSSSGGVTTSKSVAVVPEGFVEGKSVEVVEERDERTKVYANPDGTKTAVFSTRPTHVKDDKGKWQDADASVEKKDGRVKSKRSRVGADFAERANDERLQSITFADGNSVEFKLEGAAASSSDVNGKNIKYKNALADVDIEYVSETWGVKENIILHSPSAPDTYVFPFKTKGVTARIDEATKDVVFVDKNGKISGRMAHGMMEDSNLHPEAKVGARSDGISFSLIPWGKKGTAVQVNLDRAWLQDPARVYPVVADPPVYDESSTAQDTFVTSGFTANNAGVNPLHLGTYDGGVHQSAVYIQFPNVQAAMQNRRVRSASYNAFNSHSWSCNSRGVGLYRVTQAWSATTMTGWPGATYGARDAWAEFARGYSSACSANYQSWDITDLTKGWASGSIPNFGLTLRVDPGSENDNFAWKKFNSVEGGGQFLRVTYSDYDAFVQPAANFQTRPTPNSSGVMPVILTNKGVHCWPANGTTRLSYHVYDANTLALYDFENTRTFIHQQVCTGGQIQVNAVVDPLPVGNWLIAWDIVEEGVRWYSTDEGLPTTNQTFTVTANAPPVISDALPHNGATLSANPPTLSLVGHDPDNWPGVGLQYQFRVCSDPAMSANCQYSGIIGQSSWTPPNALQWGQAYYWRALLSDQNLDTGWTQVAGGAAPFFVLNVVQPAVASRFSSDAYSINVGGVNLATGNFTSQMTDAAIGGIDPKLQIDRTYNSLDDRDGPFGRGWSFNYDSRLTFDTPTTATLVLPNGRQARLGKNPDNTFTTISGYRLDLAPHGPGYKTRDSNGTAWIYDGSGRLTQIVAPQGTALSLAYDGAGKLSQVTNSTNQRSLTVSWNGSRIASIATNAPEPGINASVWTYQYSGDKLTSVCTALGSGNCSTYTYATVNGKPLLTKVSLPKGNDSASVSYNASGAVEWRKDGRGKQWSYGTTTTNGIRTVIITDPRTNTTIYTFSPSGHLTAFKDAQNQIKLFEYNSFGFLSKVTDALGHVLELGTDARGNIVRRTVERGDGTLASTYYSYFVGSAGDPRNDKLTGVRDGRSSGPTDDRYLTEYAYNAAGLMTTSRVPTDGTPATRRSTTWTYAAGTEPAIGGGTLAPGLLTQTTDPNNKQTSYAYDSKGDLRSVTNPAGMVTSFTYDDLGRQRTATEVSDTYPSGLLTTWTYDALNRVTTETLPEVTNALVSSPRKRSTTNTYDANGNLTQQTVADANGNDAAQTTTYTYDGADRPLTITNNMSGVESRTYDNTGNLATVTSPGGVKRSFTYTSRDELATTTLNDFVDDPVAGSTPRDIVLEQRTYDQAGRLSTTSDALGRTRQYQYYRDDSIKEIWQLGFHNPDNTTRNILDFSYVYDGAGNITSEIRNSGVQQFTRQFDAAGRVTSEVVDPTNLNRAVSYTYDANDNVTKVRTTQPNNDPREIRYSYSNLNMAVSTTVENGVTDLITTHHYDQRGALISEVDARGNESGADTEAYRTTYQNDQLGRQVSQSTPQVDVVSPPAPQAGLFTQKVNFQTATSSTPAGYVGDHGQPFDNTRGYGWKSATNQPVDLTGFGRERNVLADKRLDTFMHMQHVDLGSASSWETNVPNGTYDVTVGVGDPNFTDSHHVVRAEGITVVDLTPTANEKHKVGTSQVTVVDGRLTLDSAGGTNTKIDYVDIVGVSAPTPPPSGGPVARVNFQTQATTTPPGYQADFGQAYDAGRGYGWENLSGTATSLVGNGRERNTHPDKRLDTYMHMQLPSNAPGVPIEGRWQLSVPNGNYNLTVGLGDPSYTDSHHVLRAEGSQIANFTPTTGEPVKTFTTPVSVADGKLTLDAAGGTNTKLSYIDLDSVATSDPSGGTVEKLALTTNVGYDVFGNVTRSRTADAADGVTTYSYDGINRLTSTSKPFGSGSRSESRTYDADGNVLTETDPRSQTTSHVYDKLGRVVKTTDPKLAAQPAGGVTRYQYNDMGAVTQIVDQRGAKTTFSYDDRGNRTTETVFERTPANASFATRYEYDDAGRPVIRRDPLNFTTAVAYNAAGEETSITDAENRVTSLTRNTAGQVRRTTDPLGRYQQHDYDLAGRLTATTHFDAFGAQLSSEGYGYDAVGNQVSRLSPEGSTTSWEYDATNVVTVFREPVSSGVYIITRLGYDKNRNRTSHTNGNGATTFTWHNELDLPSKVMEPSTASTPSEADRTWTYAYNPAGALLQTTAPGSVVRTRTYDELGRQTNEAGTGGSGSATGRTVGYDLAGNITSIGTPDGTQSFIRNDRGQVTAQTGPEGGADFAYDSNSRLISRSNDTGNITYTYTGRGQLASLIDPITSTTSSYTYDHAGQLTTVAAGSTTRSFAYDGMGRLTSDQLVGAGAGNSRSTTYGYDANSNMTSKNVTVGSTTNTNTYTYDRSDRLSVWSHNGSQTQYSWDGAGNRIGAGASSSTYDARNRLISSTADGGSTFTYTPRGTLATETKNSTTTTLQFDSFDRLVSESSDPGATFTYDAFDRLQKRNGTRLLYDRDEAEPTTDNTFWYTRGPDGKAVAVSNGASDLSLLSDQHGDIVGSYSPNGSVTADVASYDPFGKKIAESGFQSSLGFQGSWTNDASNADRVWMQARWYTPGSGTFTSRDRAEVPFTSTASANRFTYGNNNPLRFNDPTGRNGAAVLGAGARGGAAGATLGPGGVAVAGGATAAVAACYYYCDEAIEVVGDWWNSATGSSSGSGSGSGVVGANAGGVAGIGTTRGYYDAMIAQTGAYYEVPIQVIGAAPATNGGATRQATQNRNTQTQQRKAAPVVVKQYPTPAPLAPGVDPSFANHPFVNDLTISTAIPSTAGSTATDATPFIVPDAITNGIACSSGEQGCFEPPANIQQAVSNGITGDPKNQYQPEEDVVCPAVGAVVEHAAQQAGTFALLPCGTASNQASGSGPVRTDPVNAVSTVVDDVPQVLRNKQAGDAARDRVAVRFPGALPEQSLPTSLGTRRVDILTTNQAIEVKNGRTSLTNDIRTQIAKDLELLGRSDNNVRSLMWVFTRSETTGKIGPTAPLAEALDEAKIPWVINP